MTKFFNIFKKPCFWPIFPIFWAKCFFWKIWLSHTTSYGFLASCQNLEKTNDKIPRKHPDRRKDKGMQGQTDPILQDPSGYRQGSNKDTKSLTELRKYLLNDYFFDNIAKSQIQNPIKSLWWSFFAKIVIDFQLLTFFAKAPHHVRLCCL